MNDKLSNALAELAEKFGTTVEHLWLVLLYQARIDGITRIIDFVICGILLAVAVWAVQWIWKGIRDERWDEVAYLPLVIITFAAFILVIFTFASLETAITDFANPEYFALKQIIH